MDTTQRTTTTDDEAFSAWVQGRTVLTYSDLDAALQRAYRMGKPVAVRNIQHDMAAMLRKAR